MTSNHGVGSRVEQPRSVPFLEEQLEKFSSIRNDIDKIDVPDFATQIGLESINKQIDLLNLELAAAQMLENNADVEICFNGSAVISHSIDAGFIGEMLLRLQGLAHAIAETVYSKPTKRGPVKDFVSEGSRLMLSSTFVGSFGLRFHIPKQKELQLTYDLKPQIGVILDRIEALLTGSELSEESLEIASLPRVSRHYKDVLQLLNKQDMNVVLRTWRNPYGSSLVRDEIQQRLRELEITERKEEVIETDGILTGGNIRTYRFELKTRKGIFKGRVRGDAIESMKECKFGTKVFTRIEVIQLQTESTERTAYTLISIKPAT